MKNLFEVYEHRGEGYNPYLITDKWQVAQLNFTRELAPDEIFRIERHNLTEKVFILFSGRAILISGSLEHETMEFFLVDMIPGITYNVPEKVWHNIAMTEDAKVIIVENSQTHLRDVEYFNLTASQKTRLQALLKEYF